MEDINVAGPEINSQTPQYRVSPLSLETELHRFDAQEESQDDSDRVVVSTASPLAEGGKLVLSKSLENFSITFQTNDEEAFIRACEGEDWEKPDWSVSETGVRKDTTISEMGISVTIESTDSSISKVVSIATEDDFAGDLRPFLASSGLSDLLRANKIPRKPEKEYIQKIITEGSIAIEDRNIPVAVIEEKKDILGTIGLVKDRVYHGTDVDSALSILQLGVLSRKSRNQDDQRYVLSSRPDGISADIANAEWAKKNEETIGYGVIIEFDVEDGGIIPDSEPYSFSKSGVAEVLSSPADQIRDVEELTLKGQELSFRGPISEGSHNFLDPKRITRLFFLKQS